MCIWYNCPNLVDNLQWLCTTNELPKLCPLLIWFFEGPTFTLPPIAVGLMDINLLVETDANLVSWPLQRFDDTWEERWLPCQVHPDKMETGFTMFGLSLKYYIRSMYQVGPTALFTPVSSSSWVMTHICYTCYSLQNTLPATSCCFHGGTHLWSIRSLNPLAPLNWHWSWFVSDPEWVAIRFFQNKFAQYNFGALSLRSFL